MSAAWWATERDKWMLDSACARYGHQDIHALRGKKRLSYDEKHIFNECVKELMDAEFNPRDVANLFGGSGSSTPAND